LVEDKRDRVVNDNHTAGKSVNPNAGDAFDKPLKISFIPHNHAMSIISALVLTDLKLLFSDCKQIYVGGTGVSLWKDA
jgi:hypothetical protein